MVKQQNSSTPQLRFASYAYVVTFAASYCTVSMTLFRILHVTFAVSCTTFLRVFQVTLMAPCSTIIATILQVFLVTFAALCCTVIRGKQTCMPNTYVTLQSVYEIHAVKWPVHYHNSLNISYYTHYFSVLNSWKMLLGIHTL